MGGQGVGIWGSVMCGRGLREIQRSHKSGLYITEKVDDGGIEYGECVGELEFLVGEMGVELKEMWRSGLKKSWSLMKIPGASNTRIIMKSGN
jgi:hypothetical protein